MKHYENFPVASVLSPPHLRPAIVAIYAFARTADDIADEGDAAPATRLHDLASYRSDLLAVAAGTSASGLTGRWPEVFGRLGPVLKQFALPLPLLLDLLSAFEQDLVQQRYADGAELLDYCRRSANPVGRLLLHLYGAQGAIPLQQSDCICSALQLINFWQDLSVDIPRSRCYLPLDAQARHGVDRDMLNSAVRSPPAGTAPQALALVAECVQWARELMLQGAPLVHQLPGRAGWELRLVVQGGLRILDKIEALGYDTFRQRPVLRPRDWLGMLWRALWMRPGSR